MGRRVYGYMSVWVEDNTRNIMFCVTVHTFFKLLSFALSGLYITVSQSFRGLTPPAMRSFGLSALRA